MHASARTVLGLLLLVGCGDATADGDAGLRPDAAEHDASQQIGDASIADSDMTDTESVDAHSGDTDATDAASSDTSAPEPDAGPSEPEVPVHERPQSKSEMLLFDASRDRGATIDYHSFRIPALAYVGSTLIAFAEARQCGHDDFGNINMVMKRSRDNGRTWGPLEEVEGRGDGTWATRLPLWTQRRGPCGSSCPSIAET